MSLLLEADLPPSLSSNEPKWERVADATYRLPVPGGWLYSLSFGNYSTFVPDNSNSEVK